MPIQAQVLSQQTMQVGANGPGDVTSMYVVSGIAQASLTAFSPSGVNPIAQSQQATFSAHVGPQLTAAQFRRAIGAAAVASLNLQGEGTFASWSVANVEADFDDDAGSVQIEFDVAVQAVAGATTSEWVAVAGISFQVF